MAVALTEGLGLSLHDERIRRLRDDLETKALVEAASLVDFKDVKLNPCTHTGGLNKHLSEKLRPDSATLPLRQQLNLMKAP